MTGILQPLAICAGTTALARQPKPPALLNEPSCYHFRIVDPRVLAMNSATIAALGLLRLGHEAFDHRPVPVRQARMSPNTGGFDPGRAGDLCSLLTRQAQPSALVANEPSCYHFRVLDPRLPLS
jgi:hypothetical protein